MVADDVEETRDGIEQLLRADGYRVDPARSEDDAVDHAWRHPPDLILVSLDGSPEHVTASAVRIRRRAGLDDRVPVVVFCVPTLEEGAEEDLGYNVYATRPDNFDQLRVFLRRLLGGAVTPDTGD
jgi:DNA-binding response OmpR family regulator